MMQKTGKHSNTVFRTIWLKPTDEHIVQIIDQRQLPHDYVVADLCDYRDGARAISDMLVRGAPRGTGSRRLSLQ